MKVECRVSVLIESLSDPSEIGRRGDVGGFAPNIHKNRVSLLTFTLYLRALLQTEQGFYALDIGQDPAKFAEE